MKYKVSFHWKDGTKFEKENDNSLKLEITIDNIGETRNSHTKFGSIDYLNLNDELLIAYFDVKKDGDFWVFKEEDESVGSESIKKFTDKNDLILHLKEALFEFDSIDVEYTIAIRQLLQQHLFNILANEKLTDFFSFDKICSVVNKHVDNSDSSAFSFRKLWEYEWRDLKLNQNDSLHVIIGNLSSTNENVKYCLWEFKRMNNVYNHNMEDFCDTTYFKIILQMFFENRINHFKQ